MKRALIKIRIHEYVPSPEIIEVVLVHRYVANNEYQQVLLTSVNNKSFVQLINISP